ncbi:MAG: hypothetical protein CMN77_20770 [Spirochaetaceae bacterium]|nr:hypothetical protein [Spirochaetaceae bacterium]|tara:strand:+ start:33292 stop:34560 length:1269 start_codon:yes stop_codon:yes gene_type:complete
MAVHDVLKRLSAGLFRSGFLASLGDDFRFVLFARRSGVFAPVLGLSGAEAGKRYGFLQANPSVWSEARENGYQMLSGSDVGLADRDLFVGVQGGSGVDYLMVVDGPRGELPSSEFLQLLFLAELGLQEGDSGGADLPVWLEDSLAYLMRAPSPVLVLSEPGSGTDLLVQALLEARFGLDDSVVFHPGRLSEEVQLREFFGDQASARLGEASVVPVMERGARAIVVDEVSDLSQSMQLRILALLTDPEDKLFWVFTSSRDLGAMAEAGRFQPALLRQLRKGELLLSPVRNQRDRIPEEVERLLRLFRRQFGRNIAVTGEALEALRGYDWPGNWQELRDTLKSAFLLCPGSELRRVDLQFGNWNQGEADDLNLRHRTAELEKSLLLQAYALHGGNQVQMARALGISRGSLQYRMNKLGLGGREE